MFIINLIIFRYNIKKLTSLFSFSKKIFKSVIIFSSILMKVGNVNTFTTTTKTVKNAATAIKIMLK